MLNYYQILDVADFCAGQEIRAAYRARCRQYHPDLVSGMGPKLRVLAEREMAIINRAYQVLGHAESKLRYDIWLRVAMDRNLLKSCGVCGIDFEPEPDAQDTGVCPDCNRSDLETGHVGTGDDTRRDGTEKLLKHCFVALHHFASAMALHKFFPSLNIVAGGERMVVSGPPGPLEITLFNKDIHGFFQPDSNVIEHPWGYLHKMGRITFPQRHPVHSAETLLEFCALTLGNPCPEYCRITIGEDDYHSYEHVLNQSVIIALRRISPWTASRLLARHHGNLVEAMEDSDTGTPDRYFAIMSGRRDELASENDTRENQENSRLLAEIDRLKKELEYNIVQLQEERSRTSRIQALIKKAERFAAQGLGAELPPPDTEGRPAGDNPETAFVDTVVALARETIRLRNEIKRAAADGNAGTPASILPFSRQKSQSDDSDKLSINS